MYGSKARLTIASLPYHQVTNIKFYMVIDMSFGRSQRAATNGNVRFEKACMVLKLVYINVQISLFVFLRR